MSWSCLSLCKISVSNDLPLFYYKNVIDEILCLMAREGAATRPGSEADDLGVCAKRELPC